MYSHTHEYMINLLDLIAVQQLQSQQSFAQRPPPCFMRRCLARCFRVSMWDEHEASSIIKHYQIRHVMGRYGKI